MQRVHNTRSGAFRGFCLAVVALALGGMLSGAALARNDSSWVGTWATAVSVPSIFDVPLADPPYSDQTLRQIVRISVGGKGVRIWLSNVHGTAPLRIGAAAVALRDDGAAVIGRSNRALSFAGEPGVTIAAGARVLSDPVRLWVPDLADLAVSIYVPDGGAALGSPVSYHVRGLQTSYVLSGNQTDAVDPVWHETIDTTFWFTGVDVLTRRNTPVIAALGDSITDGDESTPDTNRRWPNLLAEGLLGGKGRYGYGGARRVGILNVGISGNQVTSTVFGDNAQARFDRDVLLKTGVTHVIVLEGINDIGIPGFLGPPKISPEQIIAGYQQLIARGHARGLKMIGGTLTPSGGFFLPDYNTPEGEMKRQAVNKWIRHSGAFDLVIDFDALLRDPDDPTLMRADLTADGLHPNDDGYQAMADLVRRRLFSRGRRD
ncbi:MAG: SGNH/GDSL hydrolase family protein [Gammaproteobacteria bacterium]|nr:SGNH/GDSL hydrolase family protein [Gammaproteobacteria bacterium]